MPPLGHLCLVLHAHLPFVRHPEYDDFLEEDWLYEAITETYIPLLEVFDSLERDGVDWRMTMSVTPTLAAMLSDPLLQYRYVQRIENLIRLAGKLHDLPGTLSGGQQQRVAVARAIAHQPRVLLADEPTGNVDKDASAEIMELFGQLNENLGSTVVMATHDEYVLSRYPARAVRLQTPVLEVVAS